MKKLRVVLFIILAAIVTGVCGLGIYNMSRGLLGPGESEKASNCTGSSIKSTDYIVTISGGKPSINDINARVCDKLTIVNADDQLRLIAFGVHERHQSYAGVTEQILKPGEQMSVALNQAGVFTVHDHLHDGAEVTFTVK